MIMLLNEEQDSRLHVKYILVWTTQATLSLLCHEGGEGLERVVEKYLGMRGTERLFSRMKKKR
jgi:hypothetical protein